MHSRFSRVDALGLLLIVLSLIPYWGIQAIASSALVLFYVGDWACRSLNQKLSLTLRVTIGISLSTAYVLIAGMLAPVASIWVHGGFAFFALLLLYYSRNTPSERVQVDQTTMYLALAVVAPFVIIAIANPYILYLSDGWWHVSIMNVVKYASLPPPNPWLDGATLAYPFAIHAILAFLFGATTVPGHVLFLVAAPVCALLAVLIVRESVAARFGNRAGWWSGFALLFVSTIGSLAFVFDLFTRALLNIGGYLEYLQLHQGPHMWYTAMKFINPAGVNTVLQSTLMLAFFPLLFYVGTVCLLLNRKYLLAAIVFLPLISANPIYGLLCALFVACVLFYDFRMKAFLPLVGFGLSALIVNGAYMLAIASKSVFHTEQGFMVSDSSRALWMIGLFCIAYLPALFFAVRELTIRRYDSRTRSLVIVLFCLHIPIALFVYLGAIYMQTTAVLVLSLLLGPLLATVRFRPFRHSVFIVLFLAVTVSSALLIVATYSYHTVELNEDRRSAALWLRDNTPTSSLILEDVGPLSSRALFVYAATFGERRVFIADLPTLGTYAESFAVPATVYTQVFSDHDSQALCSLGSLGIDYVLVRSIDGFDSPCLTRVFQSNTAAVYAVIESAPGIS